MGTLPRRFHEWVEELCFAFPSAVGAVFCWNVLITASSVDGLLRGIGGSPLAASECRFLVVANALFTLGCLRSLPPRWAVATSAGWGVAAVFSEVLAEFSIGSAFSIGVWVFLLHLHLLLVYFAAIKILTPIWHVWIPDWPTWVDMLTGRGPTSAWRRWLFSSAGGGSLIHCA